MLRKQKLFTVEFVLALICFALFLIILWINISTYFHWIILSLSILPTAVFMCLHLYRRSHAARKAKTVYINLLVSIVSFLFLCGSITIILSVNDSNITDVNAYGYVLKHYGYPNSKGLAHFPPKIPAGAQNVRFFVMPPWLDGPYIFLRYMATSQDIDNAYFKYSASAEKIISAGDAMTQSENLPVGIQGSLHLFGYIGYANLPGDFDLVYLQYFKATPEESDQGYAYGLAVSRQRNEIIYFYGFWG